MGSAISILLTPSAKRTAGQWQSLGRRSAKPNTPTGRERFQNRLLSSSGKGQVNQR
jgi:hypothetical protein